MKPLYKLLIVIFAIGIMCVLVGINEAIKSPTLLCFNDKDTCIIQNMDALRKQRDDAVNALKAEEEKVRKFYDDKINKEKPKITTERAAKEIKEGRKNNVPSELLGLVVTKAYASDSTALGVMSNRERLSKFLSQKGSPYAYVDLYALADKNSISYEQLYTLLAITGHESNFGTDFSSTKVDKKEAIRLGQWEYHNPAGQKWCSLDSGCPERTPVPDDKGMWIQKYPSWENFWDLYMQQMKQKYFDRGADTIHLIGTCYVSGCGNGMRRPDSKPISNVDATYSWVNGVSSIRQDMLNSLLKII